MNHNLWLFLLYLGMNPLFTLDYHLGSISGVDWKPVQRKVCGLRTCANEATPSA